MRRNVNKDIYANYTIQIHQYLGKSTEILILIMQKNP